MGERQRRKRCSRYVLLITRVRTIVRVSLKPPSDRNDMDLIDLSRMRTGWGSLRWWSRRVHRARRCAWTWKCAARALGVLSFGPHHVGIFCRALWITPRAKKKERGQYPASAGLKPEFIFSARHVSRSPAPRAKLLPIDILRPEIIVQKNCGPPIGEMRSSGQSDISEKRAYCVCTVEEVSFDTHNGHKESSKCPSVRVRRGIFEGVH